MTRSLPPYGPQYGFGVYIHWPYCSKVCPYCDFNVYAAKDRDTDFLSNALVGDIAAHKPRLPAHGAVDTVYFGGGTPALMRPDQMTAVLLSVADAFGIKKGAEITLEANPNDVLRADLRGLAASGVNRLSIGVQSLRDESLSFLGRDHDVASARAAVAKALMIFPSVSVDLIYARPGQTVADWQSELGDALALGAPHLSLYELTLEPKTAFGKAAARGELIPMEDDAQADLYELTQDMTGTAACPAYEISNHAVSADHFSRHNQIYWNGGDWIGVGPGAHGRLTMNGQRYASVAEKQPAAYSANVQALGSGWGDAERLYPLDTARELLAMGLRPASGIDLRRIEAVAGKEISREKIEVFEAEGWLKLTGNQLALTLKGRLLADALTAELGP